MDDELMKKMGEDAYDDSREGSVLWMAKEFYSKKMASFAIMVWAFAIIFFCGAAYTGIRFFGTDHTRCQIMYAALFICFVHGIGLMKIFSWQMISDNSIKREVKRLELRIAELAETIKGK
ncbi:MAG TPA: DUF6768 family protein [Sedimentisphaerales bacterium]|nr:DUF6768 family protein [Sedimentisphaerales bacterium]